jgi:hypothetical protein
MNLRRGQQCMESAFAGRYVQIYEIIRGHRDGALAPLGLVLYQNRTDRYLLL